jgi:hypothetical protein
MVYYAKYAFYWSKRRFNAKKEIDVEEEEASAGPFEISK